MNGLTASHIHVPYENAVNGIAFGMPADCGPNLISLHPIRKPPSVVLALQIVDGRLSRYVMASVSFLQRDGVQYCLLR